MNKLIESLSELLSAKLEYMHCNDFDDREKTKHHLFTIGKFIIWVVSYDNLIDNVTAMEKCSMELMEGEEYENVTEAEWKTHREDVAELNTLENLAKFQELINYLT